jgi:hypothetical protein
LKILGDTSLGPATDGARAWFPTGLGELRVVHLLPLLLLAAVSVNLYPIPHWVGYGLVFGLCIVAVLLAMVTRKTEVSLNAGFLVPFGLYWVGLLASAVVRSSPQAAVRVLGTAAVVAVFLVLLPPLLEKNRDFVVAVLLGFSSLFAAVGYVKFAAFHGFGIDAGRWLGSTVWGFPHLRTTAYMNPNTFGLILGVGCLTAFFHHVRGGGLSWFLALAPALVLSNARLVTISVGVGLLLLAWRHDRRYLLPVGLVGMVGAVYVLLSGLPDDVVSQFEAGRFALWSRALESITAYPLWGDAYLDLVPGGKGHNTVLSVAVHSGIPAAGFYVISFVFAGVYRLVNLDSAWDTYVFATFVAFCMQSLLATFVLGGFDIASVFLALFLGLTIGPTRSVAVDTSSPAAPEERNRV